MDANAWGLAAGVNRWVLYTFVLLAAGSGLFIVLLRLPRAIAAAASRTGKFAAIIGAGSLVLAVGLGGAEITAGSLDSLWRLSTWKTGADSTLGRSAAAALPALIVLIAGFSTGLRPLLLVGATAAIGSFLLTGHGATAPPAAVSAIAVGLHLACAAFWLGSLYPIYRATYGTLPEAAAILTQFSLRAVAAFVVLMLSGILMTWIQLGGQYRFATPYGTRVVLKIALFWVLVNVAAYNKLMLMPRVEAAEAAVAAQLRATIRVEVVLFAVILALAAALSLAQPPRLLP